LIGLLAIATTKLAAQSVTQLPDAVQIDGDDNGGVVTSRFGPEAGVWVVAGTRELGTRFCQTGEYRRTRSLRRTRPSQGALRGLNCHQIGNYATSNRSASARSFRFEPCCMGAALAVGPGRNSDRQDDGRRPPMAATLQHLPIGQTASRTVELPATSPARPVDIERNLVVTVRNWLDQKHMCTTSSHRINAIRWSRPLDRSMELPNFRQRPFPCSIPCMAAKPY
jgi:hypothetical protein